MKQTILSILMLLLSLTTSANPVVINGINYNFNQKDHTAEVTTNPNGYRGNVVIPHIVNSNGIEYSVTSIGNNAFANCYNLTSINIIDGVIKIGNGAFSYCTSLKSIIIPNSVTTIGEGAFNGCSALTSIKLPDNLTSIENYMFYGCWNLRTFNVPDGITRIGSSAFVDTSWFNNQPDGVIYIGKVLYCYKGVMPDNSEVNIKDGTCSISPGAFSYQTGLSSLNAPNSVSYVGGGAFSNTAWYDNLPDGIVYIGNAAYSYKGDMAPDTEIVFKKNTVSITDHIFEGNDSLSSVVIPDNVEYIGDCSFYTCRGLKKVSIGSGVKIIGDNAFNKCSSLQYIKVSENCSEYDSRGDCNCLIESSTNTLIQGSNNSTIPDGITSISNFAFYGFSELDKINIPNSVKSIGNSAFDYCSSLLSVNIPNGTVSIGDNAFAHCTGIKDISISQSVQSIGTDAFTYTPELQTIIVESGNAFYDSREDCNALIYTASDSLIKGCKQTIIPSTVKQIGNGAFWGADLTTISLPSSIKVIGMGAFQENPKLQSIKIPEGVTEIKRGAFLFCSNLSEVEMANSVNTMGSYVFEGTKWLQNQPDGLVYIGNIAYIYRGFMPSGTHLSLKEGTLGIAGSAFQDISGIASVDFPSSLISIGEYSFSNCTGLKSVVFPNDLETIGIGAFLSSNLKTVVLGPKVKYIGVVAFSYYDLSDVYCYAKEVPYAEGTAFGGDSAGATLHVPSSSIHAYSTTMEWNSFRRIVGLTEGDPTPTDIKPLLYHSNQTNLWTDLKGQTYTESPSAKGLYIHNGRKYVVPARRAQ